MGEIRREREREREEILKQIQIYIYMCNNNQPTYWVKAWRFLFVALSFWILTFPPLTRVTMSHVRECCVAGGASVVLGAFVLCRCFQLQVFSFLRRGRKRKNLGKGYSIPVEHVSEPPPIKKKPGGPLGGRGQNPEKEGCDQNFGRPRCSPLARWAPLGRLWSHF